MNSPVFAPLLDTYLGAALSASNDLVTTLCEPMADLGLEDAERRVLLALWLSNGVSEEDIAKRLHVTDIRPALLKLEQRGFVLREASDGGSQVWLTAEGRGLWALCGTEEMERRLGRLQHEIVALRDVLQRTVGILAEDGTTSRTVMATA